VIDPCVYLAPLAIGDTVNGALATTDCLENSWYYDFYTLRLPTGQQSMRITIHADTFDTYLFLWSGVSPFPLLAFDDDSILGQAGARNSVLDIILPGGDYIVGASSFNPFAKYAYALSPTTRQPVMSGCRAVWVIRGVSVTDDISTTDCKDSSATPHYYDVARMFLTAGTVLSISERSTTINPSLALYRLNTDTITPDNTYGRQLVASNDDSSATNTNAFIRFAVDTTRFYDVFISTSAAGETGAYTFSVDTTTTLSPRRSAPASGAREWWRSGPGDLLLRSRGLRGAKR